jgi:hypothetical protein
MTSLLVRRNPRSSVTFLSSTRLSLSATRHPPVITLRKATLSITLPLPSLLNTASTLESGASFFSAGPSKSIMKATPRSGVRT